MPNEPENTSQQPLLLSEPDPTSIDQLLQRDPRLYSDADLDRLIEHYRAQRISFLTAEREAKASGKKLTFKPKSETQKLAANISLDDLLGKS